MKCILCFCFLVVHSCLVSVQFSGDLHPSFQYYDSEPYLVILSQPAVTVSFEATEALQAFLNEEEVLIPIQQGEISLQLPLGSSSLVVACAATHYVFDLFVVSSSELDLVVWVGEEEYVEGTVVSASTAILQSAYQLRTKVFSTINRESAWAVVDKFELGVPLTRGANYILTVFEDWADVTRVDIEVEAIDVVEIEFTSSQQDVYIWPRVAPEVTAYEVLPAFDLALAHTCSLVVHTHQQSMVTLRSESGIFPDLYAFSGDEVTLPKVKADGDTIYISVEDVTSDDIRDYTLVFHAKSRISDLNLLELWDLDSGTLVPFIEEFDESRDVYHLVDFDYAAHTGFELIANTASGAASIHYQFNSEEYSEYILGSTFITPTVGDNRVDITVTAEDPAFTNTITILFYMRSNDATLSSLDIPGVWLPQFEPSTHAYQVALNGMVGTVLVILSKSHSKSTFSVSLEGALTHSNSEFQVALQNVYTDLSITVFAETRSFSDTYTITLFKEDSCGNGLRYSANETCDDGNSNEGDGCSSDCQVESGFQCTGGSSTNPDTCLVIDEKTPPPECGNGRIEDSEECDDGNTVNGDGCNNECHTEPEPSYCGDGIRDLAEECDDGNFVSGDGCSSCRVEEGWICHVTSSLIEAATDGCVPIPSESSSEGGAQTIGEAASLCILILVLGLSSAQIVRSHWFKSEMSRLTLLSGTLFYFVSIQLLYAIHPGISEDDSVFALKIIGWSHLKFPMGDDPASQVDLFGIPIVEYDSFMKNQMYIFSIAFLTVAMYLAALWSRVYPTFLELSATTLQIEGVLFIVPTLKNCAHTLFLADFSSAWQGVDYIAAILTLVGYIALFAHVVALVYRKSGRYAWWVAGLKQQCSARDSDAPPEFPESLGQVPEEFSSSEVCSNQNEISFGRAEVTVPDHAADELQDSADIPLPQIHPLYSAEWVAVALIVFCFSAGCELSTLIPAGLVSFGATTYLLLVDPFKQRLYTVAHAVIFLLVFTIALAEMLEVNSLVLVLIIVELVCLSTFLIIEIVFCFQELFCLPKIDSDEPQAPREHQV